VSQSSAIQWCDGTVNEQMGCDGCELWIPAQGVRHCYAGTLTERRAGQKGWPAAFDQPAVFTGRVAKAAAAADMTGSRRISKPWMDGLPRVWFTNDMGDPFTESLPDDWLAPALEQMAGSPHLWLVLTKRPRRAAAFFRRHPAPRNVMVGASVTGRATLRRIVELLEIDARLFLSIEPQSDYLGDVIPRQGRISWAILGGLSASDAWPYCEAWALDIIDQCRDRGARPFVKQLGQHFVRQDGRRMRLRDSIHGGDWSEWPSALRVREMPLRHDGSAWPLVGSPEWRREHEPQAGLL
jgi:protein gp37